MTASLKPIVQLVVDVSVPMGEIHVGGVQVLHSPSDEELGRRIRTKLVRVATLARAEELQHDLREDGFEVEDTIERGREAGE